MPTTIEKAQAVRLLILDVDGVLTDGMLYYADDNVEMKGFHIHDGLGIKLLLKAGIQVAIISGKISAGVSKRLAELGIQHVYLGHEQKIPAYNELKQKLKLSDQQIAYVGDDLPDLPVLRCVGLAVAVANATPFVQQHVDWITKAAGGAGAVREVCDYILQAQGILETMLQSYLVS